jgi:hypothetical protein
MHHWHHLKQVSTSHILRSTLRQHQGRGSPVRRHRPEDWMSGALCSAGALAYKVLCTMRRLNDGHTCVLYRPRRPRSCPLELTRYGRPPPSPSPAATDPHTALALAVVHAATDPNTVLQPVLRLTTTLALDLPLVLACCNRPAATDSHASPTFARWDRPATANSHPHPRPLQSTRCNRPPLSPSPSPAALRPTPTLALALTCCNRPAATDPRPFLFFFFVNPVLIPVCLGHMVELN